jgi:1-acyl-sn-glycerol-3-phosphate acyltransferase
MKLRHSGPYFVSKATIFLRAFSLGMILFLIAPILEGVSFLFPRYYKKRWQHICGWIVTASGVQLTVTGDLASAPAFFVSNHVSYLDIPVLWHLLPASFIAKAEVRRWPFIGWFAHRQGTVFVSRHYQRTAHELDSFAKAFSERRNFIFFPEGTSSDGTSVYPFKSSFFQLAMKESIAVQPISLVYKGLCGRPMGRFFRKLYGWYGDSSLVEHLFNMLALGPVSVSVTFHPPLDPEQFSCRKELSSQAHEIVLKGVQEAFTS